VSSEKPASKCPLCSCHSRAVPFLLLGDAGMHPRGHDAIEPIGEEAIGD
jgi:hypothetical protein